jgi:RNA-directed DNA polymerase
MCSGSYFPPPVKAVPIPKKAGGVRVLGVPTVADRVAQTVVKFWLEPNLGSSVSRRLLWLSAWTVGT